MPTEPLDNMRSQSQCEDEFRIVEHVLDRAFELLCAQLTGTTSVDHCNRSGFNHGGYPYFIWHKALERMSIPSPYVSRAAVDIRYYQPVLFESAAEVELTAVAEKYLIGSTSFFEKKEKEVMDVAGLEVERLAETCTALLMQAEAMLTA